MDSLELQTVTCARCGRVGEIRLTTPDRMLEDKEDFLERHRCQAPQGTRLAPKTLITTDSFPRWRGCVSKIPFETLAAADEAVRDLREKPQYHRHARAMNAYHCKFCGRFHIGHTTFDQLWSAFVRHNPSQQQTAPKRDRWQELFANHKDI